MNKKTKTYLQLMLAVVLFASFAVAGCNNSSDKAADTPKNDSVSKPMEAPATMAPMAPDSLTHKKDTAKTRPTPGGA